MASPASGSSSFMGAERRRSRGDPIAGLASRRTDRASCSCGLRGGRSPPIAWPSWGASPGRSPATWTTRTGRRMAGVSPSRGCAERPKGWRRSESSTSGTGPSRYCSKSGSSTSPSHAGRRTDKASRSSRGTRSARAVSTRSSWWTSRPGRGGGSRRGATASAALPGREKGKASCWRGRGGGWATTTALPGAFSSNRGGNLDLWLLDRRTAGLRQFTDDPAQDWDPGFTPDGRHVLWSSDRSGHYEIWIADTDGSGARLVTHDGVDAQNPTATPDGSWIVYVSFNPEQPGIYKIHPDGSGATVLVPGIYYAPEVSPDGRYAAYVDFHKANVRNTIRFVRIATGQRVPFEVPVSYPLSTPPDVIMGRVRWTSDGRSLVFIGTDSSGLSGVLSQDFTPGRDIPSPQRRLAGFSRDFVTESLGLSPDGRHLTITALRRFSSLWIAEGVPGVQAPRSSRLTPGTDARRD